ncbi:transcriptional regulator [Flavobacterium noncentrifugens]|uniref:DNA-binding transcriptional regulator, XRE-family HTH domain n=1 Tax=Flavobacterium noncentrifugens TaxID=1128970 RepID=A0A1G8ZJ28_9FLAO|nr:helix-turn-helix transcriptional regulator [Flavobacterium noncentrifugens]GEP52632.1 transcriptional regulator [Flavobacterium noncentrifugens]SDK15023.1 DNA-binding transcriptional regulator, XRE-family HTH domain [Flavobacterium noncentrifugens]
MSTETKPKHIGRNIGRLRELRGIKQDALAFAIGVSQQTISHIENSDKVDEDKLELIAKELGVTVEAIKNFSEEAVFNIISNTFTDNSSNNNNYLCTINPIEKILELYERLLAAEKEKNGYLEKLLNNK